MKAKALFAYRCPVCEALHDSEADATVCCGIVIEKLEAWKCRECDSIYDDKEDAKDCCR